MMRPRQPLLRLVASVLPFLGVATLLFLSAVLLRMVALVGILFTR